MIFLFLFMFSKDHILVKAESEEILQSYGVKVLKAHYFNWFSVQVPENKDVLVFIDEIQNKKGILKAEPDIVCKALWSPNDSLYTYQWNLRYYIKLEKAWDIIGGGSEDVKIGILDTGCSFEFFPVPSYERDKVNGTTYRIYPDYKTETFLPGKDFVNNDNHPNDDNGHGTHISGTIAEATDNYIGLAGIAFNVKIVPIKVLDYNGMGNLSTVADGIVWGTDSGDVDVINISLGADGTISYLGEAVRYAYNKNVILVGATGNDGTESIYYPANYDEVIAVGAYNMNGRRASYSNYGYKIDVVGAGGGGTSDNDWIFQQVFMPYINEDTLADLNTYGYFGFIGTSMATPHISALCALMLSINPDLKNYEVMEIIKDNCIDIGETGWDKYTGYGIPDFERCVKEAFMRDKFDKLSDIIDVDETFSLDGIVRVSLKEGYIFPIDLYVIDILGRVIQSIHLVDRAELKIEKNGVYFLYGERRGGIKLTIMKIGG
uniref:Peptidase S8/S53 domain-containing protein n=1 Tax=candidate division WOR-3 bacterium TaxID=2052148 RepID=A0A7C4Y938_UNCW3